MSFAFLRQSLYQSKRAGLYGLGLFSFSALSVANYFNKAATEEKAAFNKALPVIESFEPIEISGLKAKDFPW